MGLVRSIEVGDVNNEGVLILHPSTNIDGKGGVTSSMLTD